MKNFLIHSLQTLLKFFFLFPIKKNRILFSAYSGKAYSCNPKYICEELLGRDADDLEIIWAFVHPGEFKNLNPGIRRVRFKSLLYLYYALTAKVVVDNVEGWSILPKRPGQCVINTWHGGGAYKGVGLRRLDSSAALNRNMLNKHKRISMYLSGCKTFTQLTLRDSFRYEGEILEIGMPRNDILLHPSEEKKQLIRKELGLRSEEKAVLFAPTFRANHGFSYSLDYDAVLSALRQRFGGEWKLLFRAHYYLDSACGKSADVMDVTAYPDMQELLLIADVLITDYSSSIWDFSLMEKPAFLFVPDLQAYSGERDFYTPIDTWPYPYAEDMKAFQKLILNYDPVAAGARIQEHLTRLGNCESGSAAKQTVDYILEKVIGERIGGTK